MRVSKYTGYTGYHWLPFIFTWLYQEIEATTRIKGRLKYLFRVSELFLQY